MSVVKVSANPALSYPSLINWATLKMCHVNYDFHSSLNEFLVHDFTVELGKRTNEALMRKQMLKDFDNS